ncbi:MAG TPA: hypothetical protein VNJ53_07860 [Gaiellaceae bacterium]|nr:hypothetical protein [Gaiellaceae bacterium]
MSARELILIVDGLIGLALHLVERFAPREGEEDEQARLAELRERLLQTAERLAAWRP